MKIDPKIARTQLTKKQALKLNVAAAILKSTASIYEDLTDEKKKFVLPLWGGGVVSHGLPKSDYFRIGISSEAERLNKDKRTDDHLYRVTATAQHILLNASKWKIEDIEDELLRRSALMVVTKRQNSGVLKRCLKDCNNQDDWQELYKNAGVPYRLFGRDKKTKTRENAEYLTAGEHAVLHKDYQISKRNDGTIIVRKNGQSAGPARPLLQEFADSLGISTVNKNGNQMNTRQLGKKVVDHLSQMRWMTNP